MSSSDEKAEAAVNPDHAWKTLSLVNEWIRHADSKAAVTLAFTGVLAATTFNLVKDFKDRTAVFDCVVVLTCIALAATAILCGATLTPRTKSKSPAPSLNRVFFASIAKGFEDTPTYERALRSMVSDPDEVTKDLADQIYANAEIARIKNQAARGAIRAALVSGVGVALIAIIIGVSNS